MFIYRLKKKIAFSYKLYDKKAETLEYLPFGGCSKASASLYPKFTAKVLFSFDSF